MSSSLSSVPSNLSSWQITRRDTQTDVVPNNGESSRQAQQRRSPLPGPTQRMAALSPPLAARRGKRLREDTPLLADEAARSTSNGQLYQNASVPSFGGVTAEGVSAGGERSMSANLIARLNHGRGDGTSDAQESQLFSERTQRLNLPEGEEEDDFLPDDEDGRAADEEEEVQGDDTHEQGVEIRPATTSTENLDNPISLEEGDFFAPEDHDETLVDCPPAKASDYIPRPFATVANPEIELPSLSVTESGPSDPFRVPHLPTPVDRMSRVIDQYLPYQADEELGFFDGEMEESYHSGDSAEYEMEHRPVLERTAVKKDIRDFVDGLQELAVRQAYRVVDRLGEGTFSSVYSAYDMMHDHYNNRTWTGKSPVKTGSEVYANKSRVKVALKRILATSSPARIHNELHILESLRGCRNVSHLITAFREEDQVIIVLPYHQSDDFRYFYRHMDADHIRSYMRSLFQALKDTHRRGIVHRDVKPANFLFDYESRQGVLCDFGLAERYVPPRKSTCQHGPATLSSLHGSRSKTADTAVVEQAVYDARKRAKLGEGRVGFLHDDKRGAVKTNRAGTRGFRAPEVLLKCPDQTVAIDIWSAGVMLLSILTHKFPVFNSNDDIEALMEIAAVFGRAPMERCALLHNRTIICNVPSIDNSPDNIKNLVLKLNPHIYTPPLPSPTSEEAAEHIEAMDRAIDLCARLLRLDATKRSTAAQALRHPFLAVENGPDSVEYAPLEGTQGKCGHLHGMDEHGRHRAYFGKKLMDMHFGMGIPPDTDALCPEHEHYQERSGENPIAMSRHFQPLEEEDTGTISATTSQNATPEKGFSRNLPVPAASGPTRSSQTQQHNKRDVLSQMDLNHKLRAAAAVVGGGGKSNLGTSVGMGLSRFIGKDKEDEAIRTAARKGLMS